MILLPLWIIALVLLWAFVVRDPLVNVLRQRAQRRRVIEGVVGRVDASPRPPIQHKTMTLLLVSPEGHTEWEVSYPGTEPPETFSYADSLYSRHKQRHLKAPHDHELVWEYRR